MDGITADAARETSSRESSMGMGPVCDEDCEPCAGGAFSRDCGMPLRDCDLGLALSLAPIGAGGGGGNWSRTDLKRKAVG